MASTAEEIRDLKERMTALEEKLLAAQPGTPAPSGETLFVFKRPAATEPTLGLGGPMDSPDVLHAIQRACHGVTWRGNQAVHGTGADEVWEEIERLKVGDPKLVPLYAHLQPMFAGYALLTGLIAPSKYDGITFGVNGEKRSGLGQWTVASWLQHEFDTLISGATPSGE